MRENCIYHGSDRNGIRSINSFIGKKWKNCHLIRVFSTPLAKKIKEIGQKVSLINFQNGLMIKPTGDLHAAILHDKCTDFKNGWSSRIAEEILLKIEGGSSD